MPKLKKLYKSNKDRMFCGICGGIAKYSDIDSTIVRIIFVLSTLITHYFSPELAAHIVLFYIILGFIVPEEP